MHVNARLLGPTVPALLFAAAATLLEPSAWAADKLACIDAHADGQALRRQGKPVEAREKFLFCASGGCPAAIVAECGDFLKRIEAETPTVVLVAEGADGKPVSAVSVSIDGGPSRPIDGRGIPIDPGPHRFVATALEAGTVETRVLVTAADALRRVELRFNVGRPAEASAPHEALPPSGSAPQTSSPQDRPARVDPPVPAASYVLGGVGLVGLGVWGGFGLAALSAQSCKGHCSDAEIASVDRDYLVSTVGLAVGAVAIAAAVVVYVLRPAAAAPPRDTGRLTVGLDGVHF